MGTQLVIAALEDLPEAGLQQQGFALYPGVQAYLVVVFAIGVGGDGYGLNRGRGDGYFEDLIGRKYDVADSFGIYGVFRLLLCENRKAEKQEAKEK